MTEVALRPAAPAQRMPVSDKLKYAQALAESGLLPGQYRRQPANLLWALEYAEMLGLHPMAAVTGVFVIEGKPSASAALISALVRRAGHRLRVTGDDTHAVAEIVRADDPDFTFRSEWTLDRAKTAGLLGKGTWAKYPAAMLKARAITEVARDACEDALSGLHYTAEELGAEVNEEGQPTTVTSPPVAVEDVWTAPEWSVSWRVALAAAETEQDLKDRWADLKAAVATGEVDETWAGVFRTELATRKTELENVEIAGQVDLLTGEVVEDLPGWPEVAKPADVEAGAA